MARFLVLEGLDGAGTTTQLRRLAARLGDALVTNEPTDGLIGRIARRSLRGDPEAPPMAALPWLFAADRADHLFRQVEPALVAGQTVICDRYVPSSLAYQSLTLPLEQVWSLNAHFRIPDLVIWVDVPVDVALARVVGRGGPVEIYDTRERLAAVNAAYERVFGFLGERGWPIARVDGTPSADEVEAYIGSLL
jgi:dTMP kinase